MRFRQKWLRLREQADYEYPENLLHCCRLKWNRRRRSYAKSPCLAPTQIAKSPCLAPSSNRQIAVPGTESNRQIAVRGTDSNREILVFLPALQSLLPL